MRRRAHLRRTFDRNVDREWTRYAGEPRRELRRALRERFILRHLPKAQRTILELGPGPGRFTPILRRRATRRVVAIDLSRESLKSARRRAARQQRPARVDWVQAAGEHLPLAAGTIDAAVVLGNIVSLATADGGSLLRELRRVVKRRGLLLADFASPGAAIQEFFQVAAERGFLPRILRKPRFYLVDRILDTGFQPYAPDRLTQWAFQFYTQKEAARLLRGAGFALVDTLAVAPLAAHQARVATIARREKRTWESLLRIEERVGRRSGAFEVGHGFVVAAIRK
jgi:ubiquinone/menaquinone biosynthesis C-methylase UbiE